MKHYALLRGCVVEYEAGWGSRHDGYLYAVDSESFKAKKAEVEQGGYEDFDRVDDPDTILVSEEDWNEVNEHEGHAVWMDRKIEELQL